MNGGPVRSLLTEWARLLMGSLAAAGIRDVVVSPGSRSTPFLFAALRTEGLRCRSIVDERDAAFFAVGHAKMTGRPVALLCTSGSAAANYFPAIVEAARSGTPLVVVTADRPFELQDADAPQTIDQVKLYGDHARAYLDTGMPDASDGALRALQRLAVQAVARSAWPLPGPVHVNARARKPLEPVLDADDAASTDLRARVDALLERGVTSAPAPDVRPTPESVKALARACLGAERGVVVCGPVAPAQRTSRALVEALCDRLGFPLLAEWTSGQRATTSPLALDAFDAVARSAAFGADLAPDLVLQLGPPPTSTGWREWVAAHPHVERHVVAPWSWADPQGGAASMHACALDAMLETLLAELGAGDAATDEAWRAALADANRAAWERVDAALDAEPDFAEGAAVRAVVDALPAGAVLALGNSLPVRELDAFCRAGATDAEVWSQRGASGIDGLVAGAAGAAAASGRPTALILGDVSLLHDIGGLAAARDCEQPLAIVVLDNGGGRIFEQLPLARADGVTAEEWRYWGTPPRIDFEAAAAAFDVGFARARDAGEMREAVTAALRREGATLIHAPVDGKRTVQILNVISHS